MESEWLTGPAPNGWKVTTLGEVVEGGGHIQTGPFGSQLHASDYVPVGIPSIMPANIGDNRILKEGIARITEADSVRLSRHRVMAGDIVYSRRGDVGRRALIRPEQEGWLCGTGCLKVRLGSAGIDPEFVSYYLAHHAVRDWILRHAIGATMPNLNTSIMAAVPLLVPPLEEQLAIAGILGALDDKIEINRRMNETMVEISEALFKSWFVDFDPVHAKAADERPAGLAPHIADLFPDAFEASELGEIPEGWRVRPLDRIAKYQNGLALQRYPPEGNEFLPVIKIRELRQGSSDEKSGKASPNIREDCIIEDGDIIFSWSGSLLVDIWCGGSGALNQHLFKVTSAEYPRWFYYHWTRHHLAEFQRIAAGKATTMGHIKRHHLSEALVAVPLDEALEVAGLIIEPLIQSIVSNNLQSRTLAELRDTLLPKLVSGKLRVPDAERIMETNL